MRIKGNHRHFIFPDAQKQNKSVSQQKIPEQQARLASRNRAFYAGFAQRLIGWNPTDSLIENSVRGIGKVGMKCH
jgi:hypothetical protein